MKGKILAGKMSVIRFMHNFIETFDKKFNELHKTSCEIIKNTPPEKLFWKPFEIYSAFSCGEYILRSAGRVEQTFGGIMSRLWDDPFEWTLPEELSTHLKILEYLSEVEATRIKGFKFFDSGNDLSKEIPTPDGTKTLFEILLETLTKAENLQGRALTILQFIKNDE